VEAILRLERPAPGHLHWPDLDVDLAIDSIEHPERYPLKFSAVTGRGVAAPASPFVLAGGLAVEDRLRLSYVKGESLFAG
jgi:hypothetical protein